jgi:hypothetical protein
MSPVSSDISMQGKNAERCPGSDADEGDHCACNVGQFGAMWCPGRENGRLSLLSHPQEFNFEATTLLEAGAKSKRLFLARFVNSVRCECRYRLEQEDKGSK